MSGLLRQLTPSNDAVGVTLTTTVLNWKMPASAKGLLKVHKLRIDCKQHADDNAVR